MLVKNESILSPLTVRLIPNPKYLNVEHEKYKFTERRI
jgi:hypothetical protein